MKSRFIFNIFILVAALNIIAALMNVEMLNMYTKPILMPLLIYLLYTEAEGVITLPRLLLAVALIFSWVGDVLLMYVEENELFFIGGLGAFLIAHIVYIIIFYKTTYAPITWSLKISWPFLMYGAFLLSVLFLYAGDLRPAVIVYGLCILAMVITAAHRKDLCLDRSYQLVFTGALLFVLSDSILAINKFVADIPLAQVTIMLTYISAQYYIVKGILTHTS
ncbi:MAG: putative membrane protein YhhN [Cyclobacteriaceae bacterium]